MDHRSLSVNNLLLKVTIPHLKPVAHVSKKLLNAKYIKVMFIISIYMCIIALQFISEYT